MKRGFSVKSDYNLLGMVSKYVRNADTANLLSLLPGQYDTLMNPFFFYVSF
jgi:hypothetical protein